MNPKAKARRLLTWKALATDQQAPPRAGCSRGTPRRRRHQAETEWSPWQQG